jgi:DNA-binding beta-propeller fold protein YncE
MSRQPKSPTRWMLRLAVLAAAAFAGSSVFQRLSDKPGDRGAGRGQGRGQGGVVQPASFQLLGADGFDGGTAWLNVGGPIKLRDLRGKIVLLDFWTYCCINCHHILFDLAKLEEKYKNELVVIGVHTPKFFAEKDTENIRQKVREYGIKHPIVSDANQEIWNRFEVSSWPTLVLIGPDGSQIGRISGEGHYDILDNAIGKLVAAHRGKDLNETPVKFFPEAEKPDNTPLLYPGKVLADEKGNRLFVSDTGHNRIVMTDLKGKNPTLIGNGSSGLADGAFEKAEFHRPQGLDLIDDTLYVADTENHAIRAVDLKAKTVTTIAGTGQQSHSTPRGRTTGPALKTALNSPWDIAHVPDTKVLYIAMAGPHQIWRLDVEGGKIGHWFGTGLENIADGAFASAAFAQPSGLATDGKHLFVADSEGSAVRSIVLDNRKQHVTTLAGTHDLPNGQSLFAFDDVDGDGPSSRLQHCLGVAYGDGKLYVADTYNNKVKVYDPTSGTIKTLAGTGKAGDTDKPALFYQPGGLSAAGSKLYVADTNNCKIRVIDLDSQAVSTLDFDSLSPPAAKASKPSFRNAKAETLAKTTAAAGKSVTFDVSVPIPAGFHLNEEGAMPYLVETPGNDLIAYSSKFPDTGLRLDKQEKQFRVTVPLAKAVEPGRAVDFKISVQSFQCSDGSKLCMIKSYTWTIPVEFVANGPETVAVGAKGL